MATALPLHPLDVGSGSHTTPLGDGVQEPLKAAAAADEKSDIPPMTASQKRNRLRKIAERAQLTKGEQEECAVKQQSSHALEERMGKLEKDSSERHASVEERLEYVEKLLGDSADKHAKWEQAHAEVEGAIVDLSDGFEMLRKRLEELCRTLPEQEEVDQVWSSIHKMEVRANEQAMKTMTLEGKLKQWQQEYDPRRYISEEFEFENGKMGAEEEEEEEAQEEEEEEEEGSGDSLSDYGDVVGMLEVIESDFARAEATAQKENDTFMTVSKVDKEAKSTDIEHKTAKKQDEEDHEGTQKELDAAEYLLRVYRRFLGGHQPHFANQRGLRLLNGSRSFTMDRCFCDSGGLI